LKGYKLGEKVIRAARVIVEWKFEIWNLQFEIKAKLLNALMI
jgi:hypothetical protein